MSHRASHVRRSGAGRPVPCTSARFGPLHYGGDDQNPSAQLARTGAIVLIASQMLGLGRVDEDERHRERDVRTLRWREEPTANPFEQAKFELSHRDERGPRDDVGHPTTRSARGRNGAGQARSYLAFPPMPIAGREGSRNGANRTVTGQLCRCPAGTRAKGAREGKTRARPKRVGRGGAKGRPPSQPARPTVSSG